MKKKILASLLSVMMVITLFPTLSFADVGNIETVGVETVNSDSIKSGENVEDETITDVAANDAVVMVQGDTTQGYGSLQAAINETKEYDKTNNKVYTITLKKNTSEDIQIPKNRYIKIDLNGHKITNVSGHTITNNSTRITIVDSSENKTGVVDNVTHGKGAIYNDINASITLSGGTYTRSAEASKDEKNDGGNSWYVIKNFGTMTIKGGVTVKFSESNNGFYSSLIGNGWQNAANAEAGTNGEPKPSEGKKKASLTISGGTFTGGQITVKNDDYGTLTISGGTINQENKNRYAVYNANTATIKGGSISSKSIAIGNFYAAGDANSGELNISKGEIVSDKSVIDCKTGGNGGSVTITGGTFQTKDDNSDILTKTEGCTVKVSGGVFAGINDPAKIADRQDVYAEGYGPSTNEEGNVTVGVTDEAAVAVVTDMNGNDTKYLDFKTAINSAPAGSTVKLIKDITVTSNSETTNFGVTVDLNGHSIDGTAVKSPDGVIYLHTKPSAEPVEGEDNTMRLINSQSTGGEIKGKLPVSAKAGDSRKELPVEIGENVKLKPTEGGDAVKLGSSAYLIYSDRNSTYFSNGTFRVTASDGDRIYGSYANAVKAASDGIVTLLHDYTGTDKIISGSVRSTLDLAGHTYIYTGKEELVDVNNPDVTLTIKDGELVSTDSNAHGIVLVGASNTKNNRGIVLDGVDITVVGSDVYGIVTNGTETGNSIVLRDSTLNVKNGFGIYFPSTGTVEIENSIINAKYNGIQMCAGELTIDGEETAITVTGNAEQKVEGDGVIADGAAVSIVKRTGYASVPKATITGGTFIAKGDGSSFKAYSFNNTDKKEGEWADAGEYAEITGGYFSHKPDNSVIAEGKVAVQVQNLYYVTNPVLEDADLAVSAGEPDVSVLGSMSPDEENAAKSAAKEIDASDSLSTIASKNKDIMVGDVTADDAKKALEGKLHDADSITIVIEPYLKIAVNSYNNESLSMDITAMYRLKATTAANVAGMTEGNSATIPGTEKVLNTTEPVTITVPLPNGFVTDADKPVYVQHKGIYEYVAVVSGDSENGFTATFTNPHGFSTFKFTRESKAAATIGGTSYLSLQEAVNAVKDSETIILTKDNNENVTVKKAVKFTLKENGKKFTGKITAGSGYQLTESGGVYTVAVKQNTGGGTVTPSVTKSRVAGDDRFETAIKVADQLKKELGVVKFNNIVVAYSDEFADALSATALAADKDAPILVVNKNNESMVKKYISANLNKGGNVYIIGGTSVVSEGFEKSLTGCKVTRLGGADRYETNLAVLRAIGVTGASDIMVASGLKYPDALSASATGNPVLLVGKTLTDNQKAYLKTLGGNDDYYVIGGNDAVNATVMNQLKASKLGDVVRLEGNDRYETAAAVAEEFFGKAKTLVIASGNAFPDGLTGGVLANAMNAPLMLVNQYNTADAADFVDDNSVRSVVAIGGTAAISNAVLNAVA